MERRVLDVGICEMGALSPARVRDVAVLHILGIFSCKKGKKGG
jgi:hypothetical protein